METNNQIVTIVNREKLEISNVEEILSSTDKEVYVKLEKDIMHIQGENLKINKLVPENKLMSVSGKIAGICYISKMGKKSIFGKVFK